MGAWGPGYRPRGVEKCCGPGGGGQGGRGGTWVRVQSRQQRRSSRRPRGLAGGCAAWAHGCSMPAAAHASQGATRVPASKRACQTATAGQPADLRPSVCPDNAWQLLRMRLPPGRQLSQLPGVCLLDGLGRALEVRVWRVMHAAGWRWRAAGPAVGQRRAWRAGAAHREPQSRSVGSAGVERAGAGALQALGSSPCRPRGRSMCPAGEGPEMRGVSAGPAKPAALLTRSS